MNLKEQYAAALKAAQDIVDAAKSAGRAALNADEQEQVKGHLDRADELMVQIEAAKSADALMERLTGYAAPIEGDREAKAAKSLGDHFVKAIGDDLARLKMTGSTVAAPEWATKAYNDDHSTPSSLAPWLTQYDRTIVRAFRRPVVSDVLPQGTLGANTNAVTYLVEGGVEGGFATVAEGGQKPQFHLTDPTTRTDALKKIAGVISFSDEMVEDADFWVSEINQRGLYLLAMEEENQLLNGTGLGSDIEGLRRRAGIQYEVAGSGDNPNADALFRAMMKVQTATGLTADTIIINPADYQDLRLAKDDNHQYFGGGFFQGQYGSADGIEWQPPLWGTRTIVSAAVEQGVALVMSSQAATVYRKGGVRVESTNSHDTDFDYNRIRTRIEERVALALRTPGAVVVVTLSSFATAGTAWVADTVTYLGDIVRTTTGWWLVATTVAGDRKTHGTTEPTFTTEKAGDTKVDDQVTWTILKAGS